MFFYLEPYTYLKVGKNGVLLVNLLDNKTIVFSDTLSRELAYKIQISQHKTILLGENERQSHFVQCSLKFFMGGLVETDTQPLQFYSQINVLSGIKAYKTAIAYSKNDMAHNIRQCTFFLANSVDNYEYFALKSGIDSLTMNTVYTNSDVVQNENVFDRLEFLYGLNPNVQVFFCGANAELLIETINERKLNNIHFVYSYKTLWKNKDVYDFLVENNVAYTLMLDSKANLENTNLKTASSIWYKVDTEKAMQDFVALSKIEENVTPYLVMNSQNKEFIKSVAVFSEENLHHMEDKMHLIMANNLVNSNYWGCVYVFPNGYVSYSLEDTPTNKIKIKVFYGDFKNKFLTGNFIWTRIRDYKECKECIYRYLCPSPSFIEDKLREDGSLKCLCLPN